jgi:hypothetical protein
VSKTKLNDELAELVAFVDRRLWEQDAAGFRLFYRIGPAARKAIFKKGLYEARKELARDGNLAPLQKYLADHHSDPELADFIAQPPAPLRPKHLRKDHAGRAAKRRARGDYVRRIRVILREKTGKARVPRDLLVKISAEILQCPGEEIKNIIAHGY